MRHDSTFTLMIDDIYFNDDTTNDSPNEDIYDILSISDCKWADLRTCKGWNTKFVEICNFRILKS